MVISLDGVLNVLKPSGMTSHDVVSFLRRELKTKKIGHAGTLDPQATGVLPLCVGQATRLVEFIMYQDKEYLCEMTLGITTTTQDAWGEVVEICDFSPLSLEEVKSIIPQLSGTITQTIPAYSAVKVDGIPLYKRTRLGMKTKTLSRQIQVYNIDIIKYEPPRVTFVIKCSKGTYVRTICHDWGQALGVGGHMSFLLRTKVGSFTLNESKTLEEIVALKEKALMPMEICVESLDKIILTEEEIKKIKHGQKLVLPKGAQLDNKVAVQNNEGKLQAIASLITVDNKVLLKPEKVFNRE
ncbi:MAG: tRNA pseudouridine(55) synthase TruB [Clostridia bacterium]|nr:tRNA pseudouridine(55) synthase TruB [Clostridia bacterium]